jgi:hypothetical protein
MMFRHQPIVRHLSKKLVQLYCPELCNAVRLTKWDCRDHLLAGIEQHWHLGFAMLPSEETLYHYQLSICLSFSFAQAGMCFLFLTKLSSSLAFNT